MSVYKAVVIGFFSLIALSILGYFISLYIDGYGSKNEALSLQFRDIDSYIGCQHNRIKTGPNGESAIWYDRNLDPTSPTRKSDGSNLALVNLPNKKMVKLYGPYNVIPTNWSSKDNILNLYSGENYFLELDTLTLSVKSTNFSEIRELSNIHILGSTAINSDTFRNIIATSESNFSSGKLFSKVTAVYDGKQLDFFAIGRKDFSIYNSKKQEIVKNSFSIRRAVYHSDERGKIALAYDNLSEPNQSKSFKRPILDEVNGKISGYFSINDVFLHNQNRLSTEYFIVDASSNGKFLSILGYDKFGVLNIYTYSDGSIKSKVKVCDQINLQNVNEGFEIQEEFSYQPESGVRYALLNYVFKKHRSHKKSRLVVYFHGGPYSTIRDNIFPDAVREAIRRGYDVIAVDYPSSALGIYDSALFEKLGFDAIETLPNSLCTSLNKLKFLHSEVIVVAESFGAIPAILLQSCSPYIIDKFHFIVPLIKMKDNFGLLNSVDSVSVSQQRNFENAVFGSEKKRDKFGREVTRLWNSALHCSKTKFYFAKNDGKSGLRDVPDELICKNYKVYEGSNHYNITANRDMFDIIYN